MQHAGGRKGTRGASPHLYHLFLFHIYTPFAISDSSPIGPGASVEPGGPLGAMKGRTNSRQPPERGAPRARTKEARNCLFSFMWLLLAPPEGVPESWV